MSSPSNKTSSTSTALNQNNETQLNQKQENKSTNSYLSEKEKHILKKQFVQIIPSYLISESKQQTFFTPSKSKKNQLEEYHKLKSEISQMETRIKELEFSNRTKLAKVKYNLIHLYITSSR